MNRQTPSANRLVAYEDFKRKWHIHENKVKNIKASVEHKNLQPRIPSSRKVNTQANPSRKMDIEFENRALLKKLTERQKNQKTAENTVRLVKNNRKHYYEDYTRRLQNEGLCRRIKDTKTSYEMKKFVQKRKETEKYINLISKFQYKDHKPTKTVVNFQFSNDMKKYPNQDHSKENLEESRSNLLSMKNLRQHQNGYRNTPQSRSSNFKDLKNSGHEEQYCYELSGGQEQTVPKCNKVLKIVPCSRKMSDDRDISIKAIEFEHKVVVQIQVEDQQDLHCLQIDRQLFEQKFKSRIRKMLNAVSYNDKKDYFYIS